MDRVNRTLVEIGSQLRAARLAAKLTLADVATRANLAESSLSRIERGQIAVSVMNLVQICDILSIGVSELFDGEPAPAKTAVAVHTPETGEFQDVEATGYRWRHLVGGAPLDAFNVFHLVIARETQMTAMVAHPGQEHCYVVAGTVDFFVGDERHRLRAGDGIMIDSERPHRAERVGDETAHVLMTVTRVPAEKRAALEWWNLAQAAVPATS